MEPERSEELEGRQRKRTMSSELELDEDDKARLPDDLHFEDPFTDEEVDSDDEDEPIERMQGALEPEPSAVGEEQPHVDRDAYTLIYRPGDPLPDGEQLVYESKAYDMMHQLHVEWPCLSFDIMRDQLGDADDRHYPHTMYCCAGTQATQATGNKVSIMRVTDLYRTKHDDDDSDDDSDSDDENMDDDPTLDVLSFKHMGTVNRLRSMPQLSGVVATWSDRGRVSIFDARPYIAALSTPEAGNPQVSTNRRGFLNALSSFQGHTTEGYALDWSPCAQGRFASGDCAGKIHLWHPAPGGAWTVDREAMEGHSSSVEDIQWSPCEENVLASCSCDRNINLWDARAESKRIALGIPNAHEGDINVISWNPLAPRFLVSGGDDGVVKVWDLGNPSEPRFACRWHIAPITSVQWCPHDQDVFAVSGEDHQITLWDLSMQRDTDADNDDRGQIPMQLLFTHLGQRDPKEVRWHPQIKGTFVTCGEGFNIVKTANLFPHVVHHEEPDFGDLMQPDTDADAEATATPTTTTTTTAE
eukprot:gnl/Trimastix_PCT/606.p1 GENE.gnl/Trimastix_PCT/606~~gnl/Trimastix_PCT/606.p1  ORF type:complete len:528 (+),score=165.63 gnl/Trimastix_PCT/606:42-1625(+)